MTNSYVVTEKIRDGDHEYCLETIITLADKENASEEVFIKNLYSDQEIKPYNHSYKKVWELLGDYRLTEIYTWIRIESEEHKQILNKYGVY